MICQEYERSLRAAFEEQERRLQEKARKEAESKCAALWLRLLKGASAYDQVLQEQSNQERRLSQARLAIESDPQHQHSFTRIFDQDKGVWIQSCSCGLEAEYEEF